MKFSSKTAALLITFGVTAPIMPLLAQAPTQSGGLLLAMARNAKQVVQYEWKQRITVIRRGKVSEPLIDQVRFDASGQMQRITISAPEQKQMRGIRGRMAANVKDDVKGIMQLAGQYNKPQQMVEAVKKAQVSETPGAANIRLQANDLINPSDSMTMLVNSTTHLANHIDIKTDYDGSPMTIAQDYGPVPGGPNMMKSMKVSVPGKDLVINVESYDFRQQSAQTK